MTRTVYFQGLPVALLGGKGQKAKPFSLVSTSLENVSLGDAQGVVHFPQCRHPGVRRVRSACSDVEQYGGAVHLGGFAVRAEPEAVSMLSTLRGERFKQDYGVAIAGGCILSLVPSADVFGDAVAASDGRGR